MRLSIGLPGVGSVSHLYAQLLASKTGARLTYVPYRGDAPARLDLLAGNIHGIASTPDFGLIADGKARLIGSTGTQRWPQTPNVPASATWSASSSGVLPRRPEHPTTSSRS